MSEQPNRSILVVDDTPANLRLLGQLLTAHGYDVRLLPSGPLALVSAQTELPDLILLDIKMPGMDGYEVCEKLKADAHTRKIPVIFISALQETLDKIKAFSLGAVDYITKPFQAEEVLARVQTHLKLQELRCQLEQKNQELTALNASLEQRVAAEIARRQREEQMLAQQSKMAAMGEMIGAIAHQWKQPLNVLGVILQDLQEAHEFGELDKPYIDTAVTRGRAQIDFMAQTIEDFRNFLRPSRAKTVFDVAEAVQQVLRILEVLLKKHEVHVSVLASAGQSLSTLGYPNEFKHVVFNLLNNARDAIEARRRREPDLGQGEIMVELGNTDAGEIRVAVRDNGGGIEASVLERLFQPYVTSKGECGTGIGLYMSKSIIEGNMGGSICAANLENGAKFVIHLPPAA